MPTPEQMETRVRVKAYANTMLGEEHRAERIAELAPGVVAVQDAGGECDAYFDVKCWQFIHRHLWDGLPEKGALAKLELGVLEGVGRSPWVTTIEEMAEWAKEHLERSDGNQPAWHREPLVIEL